MRAWNGEPMPLAAPMPEADAMFARWSAHRIAEEAERNATAAVVRPFAWREFSLGGFAAVFLVSAAECAAGQWQWWQGAAASAVAVFAIWLEGRA